MTRKFSPEEAQKIIEAGAKLEEFLNNEIVQSMVERVVSSYHTQWENTEPKDSQTREALYLKLRALKDVLREMSALVDEAKAQQVIARSKKLKGGEELA